jgi:drug/metabolite transporter (DMT)-like permease
LKLHTASGNWRLGLSLSIVTVVLWGLIPLALGVVLQAVDVATVNAFRFLSSFVLLGSYLASRQQLPTIKQLQATSPVLMLVAIGGLSCNYLFFTKGLLATSPSHAEVLIQLAHLFFGFGGLLIFKETYSRKQLLGLVILILGLVGFFHQQLAAVTATGQYIAGSFMLAFAAFAWAVYALAQKQMLQQLSSGQIMWIIYGCCGVIFAIFSHPASLFAMSPLQWGMLIFAGLNTFVAYGSFAESLAHWPASRVSAVLALAPIVTLVAMAISAPWLSLHAEKITPWGIAGAIAVVAGSISIALNDRSNNDRSNKDRSK